MATLTDGGFPTLQNVLSRLKPDGGVESQMANLLSQKNPLLQDIPWKEGNLPTGHRITSVNGLPTPTWRQLNQGLAAVKGSTVQFDESCGMLEAYSKVDVDLAKLNGNEAAFRASENKLIVEGIAQEMARAVFYESVSNNPEKIHGLSPRYGGTTGFTAGSYVLPKGTLSGVNCQSVWLINWSEDAVFGIYPKGAVAGLMDEDLGKILTNDQQSTPQQFLAYVSHFQWKAGIAVKDYRYACRMQWDPDDTAFEDSDKTLYLGMQDMLSTVYDMGPNARFYMSRTSFRKLGAQLASNEASFLKWITDGGRPLATFMGVPIRIMDSLVGESAIT
jgi:hypothetical protein